MQSYNYCLDKIIRFLISNRNEYSVQKSSDFVQSSTKEFTVLIGLHSLNCTVISNLDNTACTLNPVDIVVDDEVVNAKGSVLSVFSTVESVQKQYSSLYVDGGELFQLSTMYNCDFSFIQNIMPKYVEALKVLKDSKIQHNAVFIDAAIQNASEAQLLYKEE